MAAPPLDPEIRRRVAEVYAACGNKAETARRLGIDRMTVAKYVGDAPESVPTPALDLSDLRGTIDGLIAEALARHGKVEAVPQAPVKVEPPGRTRSVAMDRQYERVAFLSDLHCPFHDIAAIRAVLAAVRDFRPDLLVLGGDGVDCYSISDHDTEPGRAGTIQDEFDAARPVWREIDDIGCPVAYLLGNHEDRIYRLQCRKPGLFDLRSLDFKAAADLPARWQVYPNQTRLRLGSLTILHGDLKGRGTSSTHAAKGMLDKLRTSCLFGHLHRFQSFYQTTDDGTYRAGYAVGHLCDVEQARYIACPDWQQGAALIEYDWSHPLFTVTPLLVVRGAVRHNGETYKGDHA